MRYPLVELATGGAVRAGACWRWGATPAALAWCGFCAALLALALIDWDTTLLPDDITLPLLWAGLIVAALALDAAAAAAGAVWGAVAGYLSLWAIYQLFKLVTGKEGMGYGDFKLFAALGAWFGWQALVPIILHGVGHRRGDRHRAEVRQPAARRRLRAVRPLPGRRGPHRAWCSARSAILQRPSASDRSGHDAGRTDRRHRQRQEHRARDAARSWARPPSTPMPSRAPPRPRAARPSRPSRSSSGPTSSPPTARSTASACASTPTRTRRRGSALEAIIHPLVGAEVGAPGATQAQAPARAASCSTSRCWSSPAAGARRSIACWWSTACRARRSRAWWRAAAWQPAQVQAIIAAQAPRAPAPGGGRRRDLQRGPLAGSNCRPQVQQVGRSLRAMMAVAMIVTRPRA